MGLVFVLLTGEIDLAAGTASGLTAAVMALHLVRDGNLLGAMGTTVFVLFAAVIVVAIVLAVLLRIWAGGGVRRARRCCCWSSGSRRTRGWRCCSRSASAS